MCSIGDNLSGKLKDSCSCLFLKMSGFPKKLKIFKKSPQEAQFKIQEMKV